DRSSSPVDLQRGRPAGEPTWPWVGNSAGRRWGEIWPPVRIFYWPRSDMGSIYRDVTRTAVPQATICFDPFHVIKWANEALEAVHRATPATAPLAVPGITPRRAWKRTRYTLRVAAESHEPVDAKILTHLRRHQWRVFRAWQLKEALRELYQGIHPDIAAAY